jgi:hypothetical protein
MGDAHAGSLVVCVWQRTDASQLQPYAHILDVRTRWQAMPNCQKTSYRNSAQIGGRP